MLRTTRTEDRGIEHEWQWIPEPGQPDAYYWPDDKTAQRWEEENEAALMADPELAYKTRTYEKGVILGPNIRASNWTYMTGNDDLKDVRIPIWEYAGRFVTQPSTQHNAVTFSFGNSGRTVQEAGFSLYYLYWLERFNADPNNFMKNALWVGSSELGWTPSLEEAAMLNASIQWMTETDAGKDFAVKAGIGAAVGVTVTVLLKKFGGKVVLDKLKDILAARAGKVIARVAKELDIGVETASKRMLRKAVVRQRTSPVVKRVLLQAAENFEDCMRGALHMQKRMGRGAAREVNITGNFAHWAYYDKGKVYDTASRFWRETLSSGARGRHYAKALDAVNPSFRKRLTTPGLGVFTDKEYELVRRTLQKAELGLKLRP